MKFSIEQPVLKAAIEKAAGSLTSLDLLPVLKDFLIQVEKGEDSSKDIFKIQSTDLVLSTIVKLEGFCKVEEPGSATLPARKLITLVSKIRDTSTISFLNEELNTLLKSEKNFTTLMGKDPSLYPSIDDWQDENSVSMDRKKFLSALERVSYAMSADNTKVNLIMVSINDNMVVGTDGSRVSVVDLVSNLNSFKIPKGAVIDLVKVLKLSESDTIKINTTESSNLFLIDGNLICSRLVSTPFPDIKAKFLDIIKDYKKHLKINRIALLEGIGRVSSVSDSEKMEVILNITSNNLKVSSVDRDGNSSIENIPCFWDGSEEEIKYFNYSYLEDMLSVLEDDEVILLFGPDEKLKRFPVIVKEKDYTAGVFQRNKDV